MGFKYEFETNPHAVGIYLAGNGTEFVRREGEWFEVIKHRVSKAYANRKKPQLAFETVRLPEARVEWIGDLEDTCGDLMVPTTHITRGTKFEKKANIRLDRIEILETDGNITIR